MLFALLIATLSINDAKMFFQGGEAMPNVVESVPGDSLRAGAILPEVYGTISGWLERTWLTYGVLGGYSGITNLNVAKTATLASSYGWPAGCGIINSNRVITTRHVWQPLLNGIADSLNRGWTGVLPERAQDQYGIITSSTALGGMNWPTISWTEDFIGAVSSNEWAQIWPTFMSCEPDGVWKTDQHAYGNSIVINILSSRASDWMEWYDNPDYGALESYLDSWRSPKSCLDILKEKIGDEAYALTNRTMRLDRRFLTALENAIGLCDVMVDDVYADMPAAKFIDLSHRCSQFATATTDAVWSYSPSAGWMSISTDPLAWSTSTSISTTTNFVSNASAYIAVSYESSESASLRASLSNIPLTLPASNLYAMAVSAAGGAESWSVDASSTAGGSLTYWLSSTNDLQFTISVGLNGLAGTNQLIVSAAATQSHGVRFTVPEFTYYWDYGFISKPLWKNGFVDSLDCAFLPMCTRWAGDAGGEDSGGYPSPGEDSIREFASDQLTFRGGLTESVRNSFDGRARDYISHAAGHVNSYIGGNIGVRSDMIPLSKMSVFSGSVLDRASIVTSGGPAELKDALQSIEVHDSGSIVVFYDGDETIYNGSSGEPVKIAELRYQAEAALTNSLPHVSSAGAEVYPEVLSRAKMNWRNLRFEDD